MLLQARVPPEAEKLEALGLIQRLSQEPLEPLRALTPLARSLNLD